MSATPLLKSTKPLDRQDVDRDKGYYVSPEKLNELFPGLDPFRQRKELRNLLIDEGEIAKPKRGPTERPDGVRIAEEADEEKILDLLIMDLIEAGADKIAPISRERVLAHIQAGTRKKGGVVGVIDGPDGAIIACVCMVPCQWYWSEGWFLQDVWSVVHPDHRKSDCGKRIVRFACWIADVWTEQFGYQVYLLSGVLATKRAKSKFRFFRKLMTQIGIATLYPAPEMMG